jgi:hypothetical protein
MAIKLFSRKKEVSILDEMNDLHAHVEGEKWVVSWVVRHSWAGRFFDNYYAFEGTEEEVTEVLEYLHIIKKRVVGVNVKKSITQQMKDTSKHAHFHTINGEIQHHSWEECPENPNIKPS